MNRAEKKGNNIKKRSTASIAAIYLAVTTVIAAVLVSAGYLIIQYRAFQRDSFEMINSFEGTYQFMLSKEKETADEVEKDLCVSARLTAAALRESGFDKETGSYGDGWIIKKSGSGVEVPDSYNVNAVIKADDVPDEYGSVISGSDLISFAKIRGSYYYVEINKSYEENKVISEGVKYQEALENFADAAGCDFIIINKDAEGGYAISAGTGTYAGRSAVTEAGVVKLLESMGSSNKSDAASGADSESPASGTKSAILRINGRLTCAACVREFDTPYDPDYAAVMFMPLRAVVLRSLTLTSSLLLLAVSFWITFSVWIISIFRRIRKGYLNDDQLKLYSYEKIKKTAIAVAVTGALLSYAGALFGISLDSLFVQNSRGQEVLEAYFSRLDGDVERSSAQWENSQNRYKENATRLASLIDENRELANEEWLSKASDIIEADYIMIFDENGDELVTDSQYKGISLKNRENPDIADFSRLLNGVDSISHEGVEDEVTGLMRDYHGICLRYMTDGDSYGALLVAVDPEKHSWVQFRDYNEIAASMVPEGSFLIEADPDSGTIMHSGNKPLIGQRLKRAWRSDTFMDFIKLKQTSYFAMASSHSDMLYYYGIEKDTMLEGTNRFAIGFAAMFLAVFGALCIILLKRYPGNKETGRKREFSPDPQISKDCNTEDDWQTTADRDSESAQQTCAVHDHTSGPAADLTSDPDSAEDARIMSFSDFVLKAAEKNSRLMKLSPEMHEKSRPLSDVYADITPEKEAMSILQLLVFLFTLFIGIGMLTNAGEGTVYDFVFNGKWTRGFNLFSAAAIFFLISELLVFMALIKMLSAAANTFLSSRRLTICALLLNILQYAAMIGTLLLSLGYLGVNTDALIASAGFMGLALSMGVRDVITDVLAGIAIITGKSFEVGDVIEIQGFGTGTVKMIGLRRTELVFPSGKTSSIRNSAITKVINHSRIQDTPAETK